MELIHSQSIAADDHGSLKRQIRAWPWWLVMNSICKCNTEISSDPPCRSYILLNNWQTYSDLRHHANISLITAGSPPGICSIDPRTSTRLQNHNSKASAHDITAKVRITQSSRAINTRWHRYNRGRPWSSTCVTLAMTTPIPKIYGRSHSPVKGIVCKSLCTSKFLNDFSNR